MELMDTSLDKFYKFVYGELQSSIPENILGKITVAVSIPDFSCLWCLSYFGQLSKTEIILQILIEMFTECSVMIL